MIIFLKQEINKNKNIKKILENCSDSFLMKNSSIILASLDQENVPKGYKVIIKIVDDSIEWDYAPDSDDTKIIEEIHKIRKQYSYKLPSDWEKFYLIDLNDVNWTEDKRELALHSKRIIKSMNSNEETKGFWLYGVNNSGKTYGSIALLNMLALKNKTVAFVSLSELVAKTQSSISDPNENYGAINDKIKKADVVILDDLGSERPTPWFKENILLPIIDYRFKANKLTIITSNSDIEKYGRKLKNRSQNPKVESDTNDKIISRLRDLTGNNEIKIG